MNGVPNETFNVCQSTLYLQLVPSDRASTNESPLRLGAAETSSGTQNWSYECRSNRPSPVRNSNSTHKDEVPVSRTTRRTTEWFDSSVIDDISLPEPSLPATATTPMQPVTNRQQLPTMTTRVVCSYLERRENANHTSAENPLAAGSNAIHGWSSSTIRRQGFSARETVRTNVPRTPTRANNQSRHRRSPRSITAPDCPVRMGLSISVFARGWWKSYVGFTSGPSRPPYAEATLLPVKWQNCHWREG